MELTKEQLHIIRDCGTEKPFSHPYDKNSQDGIYVDIVNGQPLFSSLDKFDAGCGWPSFTKPIYDDGVDTHNDNRYGMRRVEVKSSQAKSHLGHVFPDGPIEAGGNRYCINGTALRFIKVEDMDKEGYGKLKKELFE